MNAEMQNMKDQFENIIGNISDKVPRAKNEYEGEDGLLYCSVCHEPLQTKITVCGMSRIVRCICDCGKKEFRDMEEQRHREERERRREVCFSGSSMIKATFENDRRDVPQISDAMIGYADKFGEFARSGQGLLLYGAVGTGKSYFAACIANRLIDRGYRALMTNFSRIANQIQGSFSGRQAVIDDLNRYPLLILDDLGIERNSEFMQEIVYNVVDSRYQSGLPLIVTTNLNLKDMKAAKDITCTRIYDRILERCFPIKFNGESKRKQNIEASYYDTMTALGLNGGTGS